MGIRGLRTEISPFFAVGEGDSAQIDLVIDRADNFVNLCEAKFYGEEFIQTKKDSEALRRKINAIAPTIPKKSSIRPILITTFGLSYSKYSRDYEQVLTLDDLFR